MGVTMPEHREPLSMFYTAVVLLNVALYCTCYMAQVPLLPYLVERLSSSHQHGLQYSQLQTFFAAVQFAGGLLGGPIIDHYGGRALLLVSFASSAACYALTASATSMSALYLSRLFTLFQHAVLAARTIAVDGSSGPERARVLGYVGVAVSVGFALGPAVGGVLSSVSLTFTAWVATAGSLLSFTSVLLLLPSTLGRSAGPQTAAAAAAAALAADGADDAADSTGGKGGGDSTTPCGPDALLLDAAVITAADSASAEPAGKEPFWARFYKVWCQPGVPAQLTLKTLASLGPAMWQSMFAVILQRHYGLPVRSNGFVLSFIGCVSIFCQGLLIAPTVRWLGEPLALLASIVIMMCSLLGMSLVSGLWQLLVLLVPMVVGSSLLSTVSTAQLTKAVPQSLSGTALAMDMALFSGVRMLSPGVGGYLLSAFGPASITAAAAALEGMLVVLVGVGAVKLGGGDAYAFRAFRGGRRKQC